MTTNGAPSLRRLHTAVWTGSEMIIWGGYFIILLNDGGRYNPVANTWAATTTAGAPDGRLGHTALWTGREMLIWGGDTTPFSNANDVFIYAPGRSLFLYQRL
jgi:hypothetical protein